MELAELDLEFFARFYFPHFFFRPLSWMHREIFDDLRLLLDDPDIQNEAIAVFRGGGKTTIATNVFPIYCVVFKKRRYIIIMEHSYDQAKEQLATIKRELEHNERINEDFESFIGPNMRWSEDTIETKNRVLVQALGSGSQVRGRKYGETRPDLFILDDMESLEQVSSPTQRERSLRHLHSDILPAGDPDTTRTLIVGNYLHHQCMLKRCVESPMFKGRHYSAIPKVDGRYAFSKRQDLWDQWKKIITDLSNPEARQDARLYFEANEEAMLDGAQVTYSELYPYYRLMEIWVDVGTEAFFTEYLNEPSNPDDRYFKYETYRVEVRQMDDDYRVVLVPWDPLARKGQGGPSGKTPWPLDACTLYAATDPSMGASDKGDPSALLVCAVAPDNRIFVLRAEIEIRTPHQIIALQNDLLKEYPIAKWGIETVQFQAFFANVAADASMEAGVFGNFSPIPTTGNKILRINSLQPDLENGYILIAEDGQEVLRQQLDQYAPGKAGKVDGLDALEMVRTLIRSYQMPDQSGGITVSIHTFGGKEPPQETFDEWKAWLAASESEKVLADKEGRQASDIPMPEDPFPVVFF